jgi:hypothetical protein
VRVLALRVERGGGRREVSMINRRAVRLALVLTELVHKGFKKRGGIVKRLRVDSTA